MIGVAQRFRADSTANQDDRIAACGTIPVKPPHAPKLHGLVKSMY